MPMARVATKHLVSKPGLSTLIRIKPHSILLPPVSRTLGLPDIELTQINKDGDKRTERASVCLNRLNSYTQGKKNLYPNTCTLRQALIRMFITTLIITVKNKNNFNANL